MAAAAPARASADSYPGDRNQRLQRGHEQRKHLSRTRLGEVHRGKRTVDPIAVLLAAHSGRVRSLLATKYGRMSVSPFAFFRGSVSIMAADLASQPHTGLFVQLCGDAHVQNLGSFETPDGRVVFDINDFDETIAGPWEWDVKRMAASIVLAGFESGHGRSGCSAAAETFARAYCGSIAQMAEEPILAAARHQIHRLGKAQAVSAALQQAQRARPADLIKKYTEADARERMRFKKIEGMLWRIQGQQRQDVLGSLGLYRESLAPDRLHLFEFFRPIDVAFKIVGTGSVGLRDYVVLMEGSGPKDPLFLQVKQEVASAYAPYLKHRAAAQEGERVVIGQRRIQALSDLLLGWTRIGEHDYLVRQLNDHKGSVDLIQLRGTGLNSLAEIAGELLARGHVRSGDALAIKGYFGTGDKVVGAIVRYGLEYAATTQHDFELFQKAIKAGRVKTAH
ncbi:MAG: DUF2252 domain-containing protein [Acidobacteriaceae bacterium]|nr:DUF2252 domain-containing protein [Acidobacteriaceae bacterium]